MEKIFFWMMVISGAVFVLQTLIGVIGGDIDLPDDHGIGGFFTFRNLVSFLLGISVVGYFTLYSGLTQLVALVGGVVFGVFLVFVNMGLMRLLHKLEQKNEIQPHEYRGIYATVKIKIPVGGVGKVEFALNERIDEMMATSTENTDIEKNTQVQVEKLQDNGVLLVHRLLVN